MNEELKSRCSRLSREIQRRFGSGEPVRFFRAPGRVDLMGSHTDYNLGVVLAGAVDRDIIAAARLRPDGRLNFYSLNLDQEVRVRLPEVKPEPAHGWANYPKGVIHELAKLGFYLTGLDLAVHGTLPVGGNLSSSAALEAVTARAVLGLLGQSLAAWEMIHLCRRAETDFVGMPCGILDQFTVIMGRPDLVLFLDCRSLEFERFPFPADQAMLVVVNSGVGRQLVASEYPARVNECRQAVDFFRRFRPAVQSLREVNEQDLEVFGPLMPEVLLRRARHVVTENRRVKEAAAALSRADLSGLGRIMEAGFQSSRADYQISTPELDVLHEMIISFPGVLGARIAGAGWGGCLVALVQMELVDKFIQKVPVRYRERTGREGSAIAVRLAGGPEEITFGGTE